MTRFEIDDMSVVNWSVNVCTPSELSNIPRVITDLTIEDIKKMNVIAAEAAFISEDKRLELIEKLKIVMD